jgi:hypothetical protein
MTMDFSEICLTLTTGIAYVLYPADIYDKILYDAMKAYNRVHRKKDYSYTIQEFLDIIGKDKRIVSLISEIEDPKNEDTVIQLNTIIFLYSILDTYPNLKKISFEISDEEYERITKDEIGNKEDVFNFQIFITDVVFDASMFFTREMMDIINKELIKSGKLSNSYLSRSSYVELKWRDLSDVLSVIGVDKIDPQDAEYYSQFVASLSAFFGEKAEETNVLYITDYTTY